MVLHVFETAIVRKAIQQRTHSIFGGHMACGLDDARIRGPSLDFNLRLSDPSLVQQANVANEPRDSSA
jgi:hypothetical protein